MPVIDFEGRNTEEAIEKACAHLRLSPDELKFEIVSTGSSGIFGLGSKKALIRVAVEEKLSGKKDDSTPENREPREVRREERSETDRPRRDRDGGGRRGGRPGDRREKGERRPDRPARPKPEPMPEPQVNDLDDDDDDMPLVISGPMPLPPTVPGPGETMFEGPEDEVMIQARETMQGILERMNVAAQVTVRRIEDRIILSVEGENSGLMIGKKGATLDAFQFVVNKVVNRTRTDKQRVIVDTEDYRQRRHQSLIDLAARMAAKAKRSRRPVTISALSSHDRRVVHLALQNEPGLKTRSRGDGPFKNVVIIPGSRGGRKTGARLSRKKCRNPIQRCKAVSVRRTDSHLNNQTFLSGRFFRQ